MHVSLYDVFGRAVNFTYSPTNGMINGEQLANGKYILKISLKDQEYIGELIITN